MSLHSQISPNLIDEPPTTRPRLTSPPIPVNSPSPIPVRSQPPSRSDSPSATPVTPPIIPDTHSVHSQDLFTPPIIHDRSPTPVTPPMIPEAPVIPPVPNQSLFLAQRAFAAPVIEEEISPITVLDIINRVEFPQEVQRPVVQDEQLSNQLVELVEFYFLELFYVFRIVPIYGVDIKCS
ncbi:hypothetical protein RCL1_009028 [Eukaryota sp. TZLM3-RCL]